MIALCCPVCRASVNDRGRCAGGHEFERRGGVLRLLDPAFREQLERLECSLRGLRQADGKRVEDPARFDGLPFDLADADPEWALRAADAVNVARLLPAGRSLDVLDIGAWNGWLSHRLAALGHSVVAVDYFADEFDGLGARMHYSSDFCAIQMDLADLSVLQREFDLVVVNHGLAFFGDPLLHLRNAHAKLRTGGQLAVLGLQFFRDPRARQEHVLRMRRRYRERHGTELFFRPTRAYLDWQDKTACERAGLVLRAYRHLWHRNAVSRLRPQRPFYCWGVMTANRPH
jgi:SAM-dependent methyltransferase